MLYTKLPFSTYGAFASKCFDLDTNPEYQGKHQIHWGLNKHLKFLPYDAPKAKLCSQKLAAVVNDAVGAATFYAKNNAQGLWKPTGIAMK
jgi:hypothetical protein